MNAITKKGLLLIPLGVILCFLLSREKEEEIWIGCDSEPSIDLQWINPGDGTDVEFGMRYYPNCGAYEIHIPPQESEYNFVANKVDSLVLVRIVVAIADSCSMIIGPDTNAGIWSAKDKRTYKSQWMDIYVTKLSETQEHIKIVVKEPETTKYPMWISFGYKEYAIHMQNYPDLIAAPNGLTVRFDR